MEMRWLWPRRKVFSSLGAAAALAVAPKLPGADGALAGRGGSAAAAAAGDFHMPLESEPHERTFMHWPVNPAVYDAAGLRRVQASVASIAKAIARFEPVVMLAGKSARAGARSLLGPQIEVWDVETDDLWCRDSGPTFVRDGSGEVAVSHIRFNGWGGKQAHGNDALIAEKVAARLNMAVVESGLTGEQGGVEHDGAGTLLAHASSWVNPNRNLGDEREVGDKLLKALGGSKMIWAPGVKGADITDYHIDALARFVGAGRALIQLPAKLDPRDPWSRAAFETYEILRAATDARGRKLELIVVPEPVDIRSRRRDFVASYVNHYVCDGAVICGEFGDAKADRGAQETLRSLYPGREIVALDVDPIGEAGGGIHCATQQQPKPGRA